MTLTARLQPKEAMISLCFLGPDIDVLRRGKQNEVFQNALVSFLYRPPRFNTGMRLRQVANDGFWPNPACRPSLAGLPGFKTSGSATAWRQRLIPGNYGLRIKSMAVNNNREVFLSVDEVRTIAQHCAVQAQAAIWLALLTGARRGAIFLIGEEQIGVDTIRLPAGHTKTNRARVIPIIPALRPWLEHVPLTLTVEGMKSAWRPARLTAGMPHVNFHDLRHSYASILVGLGVDLYTISKVLGHSSVQSTQRYAHLQVDAQRAALQKSGNWSTRSTVYPVSSPPYTRQS